MEKLKIVAVSDLHGYLPEITEPADIMLIAGDISPLYIQFNKPAMKKWTESKFANWVKSLPVDKVYIVAGNHDGYFEGINAINFDDFKRKCGDKLVYLENSLDIYHHGGKEYKIFGTPYCHIFGNWPFMRSEEYLEEKFKSIPDELDIIISHDPPYGICQVDQILEDRIWNSQELKHCGNKKLAERLSQIDYKLLVCGHIHSGSHEPYEFKDGHIVNVSILNENYNINYNPFYYEL